MDLFGSKTFYTLLESYHLWNNTWYTMTHSGYLMDTYGITQMVECSAMREVLYIISKVTLQNCFVKISIDPQEQTHWIHVQQNLIVYRGITWRGMLMKVCYIWWKEINFIWKDYALRTEAGQCTMSSSKFEPSLSARLIGSECVFDLWSVGVQKRKGNSGCVQLVKDKNQYRD